MFKSTVFAIFLIFLLLLESSCSIYPIKIEGTKIKETISNKTLFFYNKDSWKKMVTIQGKEYIESKGSKKVITKTIFVQPNGRFLYKTDKNKISTGIWHQDNNNVCFNYNGDETCGYIYEINDWGLEDGRGGCTEYPDKCQIFDTQKLKDFLERKPEYSENVVGLGLAVYKDNGNSGFVNSSGSCVEAPHGYQLPPLCSKKSYSFHDEIKSKNMVSSIKSGKVSNLYAGEKLSFEQGDIENLESTYETTKSNNPLESIKANNIDAYLKFAHEYKSRLDTAYQNANDANFSNTAMQTLMKERDGFSNQDFFDIYMEDFGAERFVELYVALIESIKANNLYLAALKSKNTDDFESLLLGNQAKYFLILNEQQRNNIIDAIKQTMKNQISPRNSVLLYKSTNDAKYIDSAIKSIRNGKDEFYVAKEYPDVFFKITQKGEHKKGEKNGMFNNIANGIAQGVNSQNSGERISGLFNGIMSLYMPTSASTTNPVFDITVHSNAEYGTYKVSINFILGTENDCKASFLGIFNQNSADKRDWYYTVDFIVSPRATVTNKVDFQNIVTHSSASAVGIINAECKRSFTGLKAKVVGVDLR